MSNGGLALFYALPAVEMTHSGGAFSAFDQKRKYGFVHEQGKFTSL